MRKYLFEIQRQFEHAPTERFARAGQHPQLQLHLAPVRLHPRGLSCTLQPPVNRKLVDGEGKIAIPPGNRTPATQSVARELTTPSPRVKPLSRGTSNSVRGCRPVEDWNVFPFNHWWVIRDFDILWSKCIFFVVMSCLGVSKAVCIKTLRVLFRYIYWCRIPGKEMLSDLELWSELFN